MTAERAAAERRLRQGLAKLGLQAPEKTVTTLLSFGEQILEANRRTNLVGTRSLERLIVAHVLDCLAGAQQIPLDEPIVDIGSGAGLPGVVIAIVWPRKRVVCLEPRAKRAAFVQDAVKTLELRNVEVIKMTAQAAGRGPWRRRAGSAFARALAPPAVAAEYGVPLLRQGGRLALYTGRREAPSAQEAEAFKSLGGELEKAEEVFVPYLEAQRHVWVIRKVTSRGTF